jgi:hypothetical protein
MADITCPKCGEPWDMECLHEETTYRSKIDFKNLSPEAKKFSGTVGQIGDIPEDKRAAFVEYMNYKTAYNAWFKEVTADFYKNGCKALTSYGEREDCTPEEKPMRATVSSALRDVLGDDLDGIAAEMEDAERLGLI